MMNLPARAIRARPRAPVSLRLVDPLHDAGVGIADKCEAIGLRSRRTAALEAPVGASYSPRRRRPVVERPVDPPVGGARRAQESASTRARMPCTRGVWLEEGHVEGFERIVQVHDCRGCASDRLGHALEGQPGSSLS